LQRQQAANEGSGLVYARTTLVVTERSGLSFKDLGTAKQRPATQRTRFIKALKVRRPAYLERGEYTLENFARQRKDTVLPVRQAGRSDSKS